VSIQNIFYNNFIVLINNSLSIWNCKRKNSLAYQKKKLVMATNVIYIASYVKNTKDFIKKFENKFFKLSLCIIYALRSNGKQFLFFVQREISQEGKKKKKKNELFFHVILPSENFFNFLLAILPRSTKIKTFQLKRNK
jgi:hypothetical protein